MKTVSLQSMPNGFELELPTFTYWLKAGAAFTIGVGVVYVVAIVLWVLLVFALPALGALRMTRII